MTIKQLRAELSHYPEHMPVIAGDQEIAFVNVVPGHHGSELDLLSDERFPAGVVANPPEAVCDYALKNLRKRGLSIEGIEPKAARRSEHIDLEQEIPQLIAQLNKWTGIKGAQLRSDIEGYADDPEVAHYIDWDGFESPSDIAQRLIREHDQEARERAEYERLKIIYQEDDDGQITDN